MQLKIKRLHPDAIIPKYQTSGAACFDLHALEPSVIDVELSQTIRTGLSVEVPAGHAMMIYSRSGHGFRHGVRLSNCVGVLDSDYRGEIMVRLHNDGTGRFFVSLGDRIAQAMVIPVQQVEFIEVEELTETARGAGGFGSTGRGALETVDSEGCTDDRPATPKLRLITQDHWDQVAQKEATRVPYFETTLATESEGGHAD